MSHPPVPPWLPLAVTAEGDACAGGWDGDVGVFGRWVVCKIMKLDFAHRWEKV